MSDPGHGVTATGSSNAIPARAVRALVAGENRRLHSYGAAGAVDRLPGGTGDLGARPVTEAIHQAGDWALRFLLITLAITPAQRILNYPRIILARRTLGVAAAGYAVLHLSLYVLDQHFDLFKVASEIVLRIYLLIGALALIGLIALAATSTDAAISRLGSQRWNALHRLVYGIALIGTVHFFIQSKLDLYEPVLMAGFLIWLLAYRVLYRRNGEVTPRICCFLPAAWQP